MILQRSLALLKKIDPGKAIMFAYAAISLGDILIGLISQQLQSRKKALFIFYGITIFFMVAISLYCGREQPLNFIGYVLD